MRIAFYTLGCKLNQAETESLVCQFRQSGFQIVSPNDVADIYIANTCTVTHIADRKSRHWLRLARRRNPHALIVATGCYVHRNPQELVHLANLIVDNQKKEQLPTLIQSLSPEARGFSDGKTKQCEMPVAMLRTRSLIKIQDGCNGSCAYCIVPKVRSQEHSLPASRIIDEVKQKVTLGCKEVVLTGTKVGSYQHEGVDLKDLVEHILGETDIERLHLSSLQPSEISAEFLALWRDKRLYRHLHLALQSGSDTVLYRMRRSYTLSQYYTTMNLIKDTISDASITTDVIVGFPAESDEEFERNYSFCEQAGFANIHVFPFSPRPGTAAARMPKQIRDEAKQERNQRMLELSHSSRRRFCEQFLGQTVSVLWEKETGPGSGIYSGLTGNYIRVFAHSEKPLSNHITPARLAEFHNGGAWGELANESPG